MSSRTIETLRSPEQDNNRLERPLIANRGEIAVRAAEACLKRGIKPVIPYTFADEDSRIVRMAKEHDWDLYLLEGETAEETYGSADKMLKAATLMGCDSVFLGYGFLSENENFVRMCEEKGRELEGTGKRFTVIAPPSRAMEIAGNKILAREAAKNTRIGAFAHIPVLEGTGNLATFDAAVKAITDSRTGIGFPAILKDPNLGGGRGNRIVRNVQELEKAYIDLRNDPENKEIFAEKFIEEAVHVEIQIAADAHGGIVVLGDERDCSTQRDGGKIIEESPSPQINDATRRIIKTAAKNMARAIGYSGVGTWEFIIDRNAQGKGWHGEQAWYFMEVNPRVQVEHGVTEMTTGVDIVDLMFDIAEGKKLPFSQDVAGKGHAMQTRIYAEDPVRDFAKTPGTLSILKFPKDSQNRKIKTGYDQGDTMSGEFDGTIALVLAKGTTREETRNEMLQTLQEIDIRGRDISHNLNLQKDLLNDETFVAGKIHTQFLKEWQLRRLKEHAHGITEFINGGRWEPHLPSLVLDLDQYPLDIAIPSRRSSTLVPYSTRIREARQRTGKSSAAEHGVLDRFGRQLVLYYHDYDFNAGSFGPAEGAVLEDAIKLANERQTFLVTIPPSGGADQGFNTQSLFHMRGALHLLNRYPSFLHWNIYSGLTYGGVPASFAGAADIQIAVDSPETRTGFSGPYIVAKTEGAEPESFRLDDAYKVLPEGAHTPYEQFRHRVVHMLVPNLEAASDVIFHAAHILNQKTMITDPLAIFPKKEATGYHETTTKGIRFDRPGRRVTAWIADKIVRTHLWPTKHEEVVFQVHEEKEQETPYEPLPIVQRLKVIEHPDRPTAADLLDPKLGIFDDSLILSTPMDVDGVHQYPPTIAALATIGGIPVGVVAHQAQREHNPKTGENTKKYDPQKPEDWDYVLQNMQGFAKLGLPLITLIDTDGADCRLDAEVHDQSHKISRVTKATDAYPHPVVSINIGMKGSGGGETFGGPADASAFFENAFSGVSKSFIEYWILTGRWIDENATPQRKEELDAFINKQHDATAEWHRDVTHAIDEIIEEGSGGAHVNPSICAQGLRAWLAPTLQELIQLSKYTLRVRRNERNEKVRHFGLIPNPELPPK